MSVTRFCPEGEGDLSIGLAEWQHLGLAHNLEWQMACHRLAIST